jgi:dTMP kinase
MTDHSFGRKGLFITFEGIEGSGKSKHLGELFDELIKEGYPVLLTREPGGTPIGERIRSLILDPDEPGMHASTELLLYLAARAQHVHQTILPALYENRIILCDRFHDSTYAYQGGGRGIEIGVIEPMIQQLFDQLKPDVTFLLDLPPLEALSRIRERPDRINRIDAESLAFHETVRSNYLTMVANEPGRFKVINSSRDYDFVHREIYSEVLSIVRNWKLGR